MKLLIVAQVIDKNHPILGFFHDWVVALIGRFDEVEVICLQEGEHDFPSYVTVYSLGKEKGTGKFLQLFLYLKFFGWIFFTQRPQFVFFHMGAIFNVCSAPFFLLRKLFGTKFYWWKAHGYINWFGKLALCFTDRVYTSTTSGFAVETSKRHIIGQAIDTSLFTVSELPRQKEVIFVGRIMPVKKIETFIEVAKELAPPGYKFTVIGPIGDQKYFDSLDIENTPVQYAGAKTHTELVAYYQQAEFFLNTSLTHSMDKTVLEAILCGCIPVTANKAFADLLSDGLYTTIPTKESYLEIIKPMLGDDHKERRAALRDRVVNEHSLSTFSDRIFGDE